MPSICMWAWGPLPRLASLINSYFPSYLHVCTECNWSTDTHNLSVCSFLAEGQCVEGHSLCHSPVPCSTSTRHSAGEQATGVGQDRPVDGSSWEKLSWWENDRAVSGKLHYKHEYLASVYTQFTTVALQVWLSFCVTYTHVHVWHVCVCERPVVCLNCQGCTSLCLRTVSFVCTFIESVYHVKCYMVTSTHQS